MGSSESRPSAHGSFGFSYVCGARPGQPRPLRICAAVGTFAGDERHNLARSDSRGIGPRRSLEADDTDNVENRLI